MPAQKQVANTVTGKKSKQLCQGTDLSVSLDSPKKAFRPLRLFFKKLTHIDEDELMKTNFSSGHGTSVGHVKQEPKRRSLSTFRFIKA